MSFQIQAQVEDIRTLNGVTKAILMAVAARCDVKGAAFPSHNYLAQSTGFCRRTIINHLKKLETAGLLTICRRTIDRAKTSNLYQVNLGQLPQTSTKPHVHVVHMGSARDAQGGSARGAHKSITLSNQSINHSEAEKSVDSEAVNSINPSTHTKTKVLQIDWSKIKTRNQSLYDELNDKSWAL